jgi:uncharacterized protein YceK
MASAASLWNSCLDVAMKSTWRNIFNPKSWALRCSLLCLLSSCSAAEVRPLTAPLAPPYSGVEYGLSTLFSRIPNCVFGSSNATYTYRVTTLLLTTPAAIADLPLTFIVDTLYLPVELAHGPDRASWQPPKRYFCQEWLTPTPTPTAVPP